MSTLKSQEINDWVDIMKPSEDSWNIWKPYKLSVSAILAKRVLTQESESRFFLKPEVIVWGKWYFWYK